MTDDDKRSYHQERSAAPPPPQGCPVHTDWSPLSDEYLAEPYAIANALRTSTAFSMPSLSAISY